MNEGNNSNLPSVSQGGLPSLSGNNENKNTLKLFDEINFDENDTEEVKELKEQKKEI